MNSEDSFNFPIAIGADNVSELVYHAISQINIHGVERDSRNGPTKSINRAELILSNPRNRYLNLKGRVSNIFQMMAETIWVMAGKDAIDPVLSHFLPRAVNFSDDGKVWRGAYGPRMYDHNQLQDVVDAFVKDGLDTRQAVVSIWNPELDSSEGLRNVYGLEKTKDKTCNCFITFWCDADHYFHMDVIQRSGDIIWGTGSINLHEFGFLHESIYRLVKNHHDSLKLGTYCQRTQNLHYYPANIGSQIQNIMELNHSDLFDEPSVSGFIDFGRTNFDVDVMRQFFGCIYNLLAEIISGPTDGNPNAESYAMWKLNNIFDEFSVPKTSMNTLWVTTCVLVAQLLGTGLHQTLFGYHVPLLEAINNSKYKKLEILV